MPSRRRWLIIGSAIIVIVAASVTVVLMVATGRWREQRAIANLVAAGAVVKHCDEPDGSSSYIVWLDSCQGSDDNEALMPYVANIQNVTRLTMAPGPVGETGVKALLHLKRLIFLDITNAGISDSAVRQLKRNNPNLQVFLGDDHRREARVGAVSGVP